MEKKEAREFAKELFFKSKGKMSNKQIAERAKVNPLTVGRWKRFDAWRDNLDAEMEASKPPGVRKRAQMDQARQLFLSARGAWKIGDLARRVGVAPGTIRFWKQLEDWDALLEDTADPKRYDELEPEQGAEEPVTVQGAPRHDPAEEDSVVEISPEPCATRLVTVSDFTLAQLAAPEHIVLMNERIQDFLRREHLTAAEMADIASAKREAMETLDMYASLMERCGMLKQ